MEYNRNFQKTDFPFKIEFFVGNIKYVIFQKKTCNIKNLKFFGIWNIPKNLETRKNLSYLEYGIFQEYSKKIYKQAKY